MNITGELVALFVTLIVALLGAFTFIWNKLDKIWKAIADINTSIGHIEKRYVEHETCEKRQNKCPCVEKIARIENEMRRKN